MGIENAAHGRRICCRPSPPHYPSWGSKTLGHAADPRRKTHLITPHGDRKHADDAARPHVGPVLITPHGDRKPSTKPSEPASWRFSLPLMGIENSVGADLLASTPLVLITPHGDRKRQHVAGLDRRCRVLITPHGDRKRDLGAVPQAVLRLITPHGDRKPHA